MIPMPALVAIMIMVSIGTFSWSSLNDLRKHPRRSSIVMLATVVTVVGTHNLALGVGVGVLLSGIFFAWKVSQIFRVTSTLNAGRHGARLSGRRPAVLRLGRGFPVPLRFQGDAEAGRSSTSANAHIWDLTGVGVVDTAVLKFRREGVEVELVGMNEASTTIMDKLAVHDQPGALDKIFAH